MNNQVIQALFSKTPAPQQNSSHRKRKRVPSPPLVYTPEKEHNVACEQTEEEETETVHIYKSRFFKPKKQEEKETIHAGDWLEQLEESIDHNDYKAPDDNGSQKENSDKVLKQAFKPVQTISTISRNPFVIKTSTSPKEKIIKAKIEPLKIDSQVLKAAPIVTEKEENLKPPELFQKEERSVYFQPKIGSSTSKSVLKKPKGMSGLLKKGCSSRQQNLFDMWTKKK